MILVDINLMQQFNRNHLSVNEIATQIRMFLFDFVISTCRPL